MEQRQSESELHQNAKTQPGRGRKRASEGAAQPSAKRARVRAVVEQNTEATHAYAGERPQRRLRGKTGTDGVKFTPLTPEAKKKPKVAQR